jgi:hypothetical protein
MLFLLAGCAPMGTLVTKDGEEPIRGAIFYPIPDPATTIQFDGGDASVLLVANSALPCEPDDVENDPYTDEDEELEAQKYWEYQLYSAFSREGALTVGFVLFNDPDADELGEYDLDADAFTEAEELVDRHPRLASGFWLHVEEAGVAESDDADAAFVFPEVLESEGEDRLDSPSTLTLDSHAGGEVTGSFDLDPDDVTGTFTADVCENDDLMTLFLANALTLGLL